MMNLIDLGIIAILALSVLIGVYRGFLVSALKTAALFISGIIAWLGYGSLSQYLSQNTELYERVLYYCEASDKISQIELLRTPIERLSAEQLSKALEGAKFPAAIENLLRQNIADRAFAGQYATLGEYADHTVASIIMNIGTFLGLFILSMFVFMLVISAVHYILKLPVLRHFDALIGGGFGLLRGVLLLLVLFVAVYVVQVAVPLDIITQYVEGSLLGRFFFENNIAINIIKGII